MLAVVTYVGGLLTVGFRHWVAARVSYDSDQRRRRDEELRRAIDRIHPMLFKLVRKLETAGANDKLSSRLDCYTMLHELDDVYTECTLTSGTKIRRALSPFTRIMMQSPTSDANRQVDFVIIQWPRLRITLIEAARAVADIRQKH